MSRPKQMGTCVPERHTFVLPCGVSHNDTLEKSSQGDKLETLLIEHFGEIYLERLWLGPKGLMKTENFSLPFLEEP